MAKHSISGASNTTGPLTDMYPSGKPFLQRFQVTPTLLKSHCLLCALDLIFTVLAQYNRLPATAPLVWHHRLQAATNHTGQKLHCQRVMVWPCKRAAVQAG